MNKNTLTYLQQLGLNESQAKVMISLFNTQEADAKTLSEKSNVPYTKIYDILNSLEKEELLKYTLGKPKLYQAIAPETIFDKLIESQKDQTKKLEDSKQAILDEVDIKLEDGKSKEFESKIWVYQSTNSVMEEVRDLIIRSKKEVIGISSLRSSELIWGDPKIIDALYDAIKRGVKVRGLFPESLMEIKGFTSIALKFKNKPQTLRKYWSIFNSKQFKFRVLPDTEVYQDFMVVDDKIAGIGFLKEGVSNWSIEFEDDYIAKFMKEYHHLLWENAKPVGLDKFRSSK